jgi:ABC-type uncharacterized transport system ATPase subunit
VSVLVALRGIRVVFPGVVANDAVDFTLRRGEIHALLGENGAGKTTLINVLTGLYRPDAGTIEVGGRALRGGEPREAAAAGVGVVHQRFVQALARDAVDNVIAGSPGLPWALRRRALAARVQEAAGRYGLSLTLGEPLGTLPVGERQKVEIVRALYRGAEVLVLDEPTAVLSRQETRALLQVLRRFCEGGGGVVLISHKLDEVLEVADRVTVLRGGRNAGEARLRPIPGGPLAEGAADAAALARLMVGREVALQERQEATQEATAPGAAALSLEGAALAGLGPLDFTLRAGEIVGFAGVAGSGQRPLADLLAGLAEPAAGRAARAAGPVGYIPEDRHGTGSAGALSVAENLALKSAGRFTRYGVLDRRAMRAHAEGLIARYDIRCPGPDARAGGLSGGNLQKLILARELSDAPPLVVAAYPCRGLDVGAAEAVRGALLEARGRGAAVALISEDLDELLRLSDRIGVLFRGRLAGPLPVAALDRERLGLMMGGAPSDAGGAA